MHTPGPWSAYSYEINKNLCTVFTDDQVICNVVEGHIDNACLIAAAPDLLEACEADAILWQHYIRCLECAGARFCTDAMELAAIASSKRAIAIAKAKGRAMSYILGPWEYEHGSVRPQYDEDTRPVAYIPMWEDNHQLREDRGYLIAAAPNMYKALEDLKHADGCYCDAAFAMPGTIVRHSDECIAACAAIAKAKGESDD